MTELAYPSGLAKRTSHLGLWTAREVLQPRQVFGFRDVVVEGLAFHSAEVRPGTLFFAIRGSRRDGAEFVRQAVGRGAAAVVAETPLDVPCPMLVVDSCRRALADMAAFYYGRPSRALKVLGVTGTNGKTTAVHLIRECMQADRRSTGLLGTIGYEYGGRRIPAANTTPDPLRLQGYMREMVDRGCSTCVMEVSSHALDQERVRGVDFDVGLFLNLSRDHLDYHGSMQAYAEAKARLFTSLGPGAHACLSLDSRVSRSIMDCIDPSVRVHTYGLHADAELRAENLSLSLEGTRFELVMPRGRVDLWFRLPGEHNVQNALGAASVALACGVSELTVAQALEEARPVRGRLELVGYRGGKRVFVDYAHTPEALTRVCDTLRPLTDGRLIVVFGCGGDRDRSKRPLMSQAVARGADVAILTSDNPRSEDPEAILDEMEDGLTAEDLVYARISDRAQAIACAVQEAQPGDTVLIAGKGHETYQILEDSVVPFDDRIVARHVLEKLESET
ncbi:MAG: UDP-N-acetylmuramoyl-L-alanyl-D-glutamate--2,6-diaminopimelate ligase [Planctomycetota bacterium]